MKLCLHYSFGRRAFSLLELAIALMITGMVAGMAMKLTATTDRNECYAASKAQVTKIKEAIDRFALSNRRFPLPARRYVGTDSPLYGKEVKPGEIAQLDSVTTDGKTAVFGTVPYAALGLTMDDAIDCWGNRLTYVVTEALTNQDGFTNETEGAITISVAQNARISTKEPGTLDGFGYAVIVHGEDQLGAVKANWSDYTAATLPPPATTEAERLAKRKWCPADTSLKSRNCSADTASQGNLMAAPFNNGNDPTTYFDDVIIFKGKPWVKESGGKVYCWGSDADGRLGNGSPPNTNSDTPVTIDSNELFTHLVMPRGGSSRAVCGLADSGKVYCWGNGPIGGLPSTSAIPRVVSNPIGLPTGLPKTIQIVNTEKSICALVEDGNVYCWGENSYGQLGINISDSNNGTTRNIPTQVLGGHLFKQIASTGNGYCGLKADGRAYCWGYGGDGQMGNNKDDPINDQPTGVYQPIVRYSKFIGAGAGSICAISTEIPAKTYCWGHNGSGKLGVNRTEGDITRPRLLADPPLMKHIHQGRFVGGAVACGVSTAGDAYCWGKSDFGVNPATPDNLRPTLMASGIKFAWVHTDGHDNVCGVSVDGNAYCWGKNSVGQLGNGQLNSLASTTPTKVEQLVAGGFNFSTVKEYNLGTSDSYGYYGDGICMLTTEGKPYCWGYTPTIASVYEYTDVPVPVAGPEYTFKALYGDTTFKCAIAGKPRKPNNGWTDWGPCTGACGYMQSTQTRTCTRNPTTSCTGAPSQDCTNITPTCLPPAKGYCQNSTCSQGTVFDNGDSSDCAGAPGTLSVTFTCMGIRGGVGEGCSTTVFCP